jgi:integrase
MGRTYDGVAAVSDSSIEITFTYRRTRCRERIKLEPTPANLKRASQHRAAVLDAIVKGTFNYAATFPDSPRRLKFADTPGEVTTVERYLESWITQRKNQLKASTWRSYRAIITLIIKQFGTLNLSELKRPALKAWLSAMKCGNKRLANVQSPLRQALHDAVMDDLLETNPMHDWIYKNADAIKAIDDVDPFSIQEEELILKQLTGQTRNMFQFFFWTGLRTSELTALRWGDIDWIRGEFKIDRAQTQAADEAETPKTKAGRRTVKLLPPAMEALVAQKVHTYLLGQEIFHDPRYNAPWTGDQPIRDGFWIPALRRAKVRYRRPYQTRHTYASRMLTAGESPMWVAAQMGHSDWGMIRRVYGKWIPDAQPEAGMKAFAMFNATKKEGMG